MFKNYYLFAQLLQEIRPSVAGQRIVDLFTFRKDELVIELSNQTFLLLGISVNEPYLLLKEKKQIKQPQLALFESLKGQRVEQITLFNFDKHLILELENFRIEAIFYPPHNNVFLFSHDKLIDVFKGKNNYPNLLSEKEPGLDLRRIDQDSVLNRLNQAPNNNLRQFVKSHFAALSKTMVDELLYRTGFSGREKVQELTDDQKRTLTTHLLQLGRELNACRAYLYFEPQTHHVQKIALMPLKHLESDLEVKEFDSVNRALDAFYYEKRVRQEFVKLQTLCRSALQKRLKFLERSVQRIQQNADLGRRKAEAELKGNLLLTFKNTIPAGAKEVTLSNIFSEAQESVTIKLNPSKSVVANAQQYFNKFKNIKHDRQVLQIKLDTYQKEMAEIHQMLQHLEQIKTLQRLKAFSKQLSAMHLIQDESFAKKERTGEALKYAFKRLILDGRWDVYIGKDGATNDLLTFSFANKWDIWLHAQGVPGAHVIIRVPNRNQTPPERVIEQAARIAAAHSKAAHSTTVPVQYTQVRYVSRMRKAPPGSVRIQNEKVVFVSPMNLN